MTSEALEPCPFCGGTDLDHAQNGVWCKNCDASVDLGHFCGSTSEETKQCFDTSRKAWNTRTALQRPAVDVELLRQGVKAVVESLEYYASDEHTDEYSNLETLHNNMPKQNKAIRDFIKGDHLAPQGYLRNPLPPIEGLDEAIAQYESDPSLLSNNEIDLLVQAAKAYPKESEDNL